MFTCSNCGKEKPDSEEGFVHPAARFGYFCLPFVFKFPSEKICKNCTLKFNWLGHLGLFLAVAGLILILYNWLKI